MNTFRNVVDKDQQDELKLGLDWLISEDGQPYFVEYNFSQSPETDNNDYSRVYHFFNIATDKLHQHQIFGDLMPPFTETDFEGFQTEHGSIVYKQRTGSEGRNVSVITPPTWKPDFIEAFIEPRKHEGKFPYVLREYIKLTVKDGNVHWETTELFRKQSGISIDEADDPNDAYKLNIAGDAENMEASKDDCEIIAETTPVMMDRLVNAAKSVNWNPTRAFKSPIMGFYYGYRLPFMGGFPPEMIQHVAQLLEDQGYHPMVYCILGGSQRALKAAQYGSDLVMLNPSFNRKWDDLREHFRMQRAENGEIQLRNATSQGGFFGSQIGLDEYISGERGYMLQETFPQRDNLTIEGEEPPEATVERILRNYENREIAIS